MSNWPLWQKLLAIDYEQRQRAKTSLLAFTTFTKPDYRTNWHHRGWRRSWTGWRRASAGG